MVVAIAVQGRQDYDQWVTSYSVKYGNDGVRFTNYGSGRRGVRLHQSFFGVFNPAHPNISMHTLHTVLFILPEVLTRRVWLTVKSFPSWWSFALFSWPQYLIHGWNCKEKIRSQSLSLRIKNLFNITMFCFSLPLIIKTSMWSFSLVDG